MAVNKKLVLVFGATGAQGSHVIDALLAPSEDGTPSPYAIRALTRDPSSSRAQELTAKGVECVKGTCTHFVFGTSKKLTPFQLIGSLDDFASIHAAFQGVYGAYVNTDGFTIGEQKEIYVNMRIFEIAKQTKSMRHYVFSGLDYVTKLSGYNPDYQVDHFNGKGRISDWLKAQPSIVSDSELSWSVINSCVYMEMLNTVCPIKSDLLAPSHLGSLSQYMFGPLNKRADGTYVFASPIEDGHVAMIVLPDLAFFVRYTFDHRADTSAQNLDVTGEMVAWEDLVKTFTKVTGQPAVFKRQTFDDWWKNFTNVDKPVANERTHGDGSTTIRQNFTAFFKLWRDDIISRDVDWIRSIHPKLQSVEGYMRETNYDGNLGKLTLLKSTEDGKGGLSVNFDQAKTL